MESFALPSDDGRMGHGQEKEGEGKEVGFFAVEAGRDMNRRPCLAFFFLVRFSRCFSREETPHARYRQITANTRRLRRDDSLPAVFPSASVSPTSPYTLLLCPLSHFL